MQIPFCRKILEQRADDKCALLRPSPPLSGSLVRPHFSSVLLDTCAWTATAFTRPFDRTMPVKTPETGRQDMQQRYAKLQQNKDAYFATCSRRWLAAHARTQRSRSE
jgi:hypothetical protein